MTRKQALTGVLLFVAVLSIPILIVHGAGDGIEGKVTDPKGAAIVGASVTITNPISNQTFTAVTDGQGRYKFEGLAAGLYTVSVSGKRFIDLQREMEKRSIKIVTGEPDIAEQYSRVRLRFTDQTFDEIKSSANATIKLAGPKASEARDAFRDNHQLLRKRLHDNRELLTLFDLYNPTHTGFFNAFIEGKRFNKLVFLLEPLGVPGAIPEEVALLSYGETDRGVWTAFHRAEEYKQGTAISAEDHRVIDILHHEIDGAIKGAHIAATDRITFRNLLPGTRVIPFDLYGTLRVARVQDKDGNDLAFVQEGKDDDSDFGVVLATPLAAGQSYQITVQYDVGGALRDSRAGNLSL